MLSKAEVRTASFDLGARKCIFGFRIVRLALALAMYDVLWNH